jgi:hypothetical protein
MEVARFTSRIHEFQYQNPMDSHHIAAHEAAVSAGSSSFHHHQSGPAMFSGDGSHGNYHHTRPPPPPNTVLTLTFTGQFDQCGLAADCGCVPNAPRIPPQYFVPTEAALFVTLAELNEIGTELSAIMANNYIPIFPVFILHFLAIVVLGYYASRMDRKYSQYIDFINSRTFVSRNCHW